MLLTVDPNTGALVRESLSDFGVGNTSSSHFSPIGPIVDLNLESRIFLLFHQFGILTCSQSMFFAFLFSNSLPLCVSLLYPKWSIFGALWIVLSNADGDPWIYTSYLLSGVA